MTSGVTAGVNISYDKAFDIRVSVDLKSLFGGASTTAQHKAVQQQPVINAITSTPSNRDVRVHVGFWGALNYFDAINAYTYGLPVGSAICNRKTDASLIGILTFSFLGSLKINLKSPCNCRGLLFSDHSGGRV